MTKIRHQWVEELLERAAEDSHVMAVILFGSSARGERARDIDMCLVLYPEKETDGFEKRIEYSEHEMVDVQVFQDLPLYVRQRVLKEGEIVLCKDWDMLYDIAFDSIKEFEYFKPRYKEYLDGVLHG